MLKMKKFHWFFLIGNVVFDVLSAKMNKIFFEIGQKRERKKRRKNHGADGANNEQTTCIRCVALTDCAFWNNKSEYPNGHWKWMSKWAAMFLLLSSWPGNVGTQINNAFLLIYWVVTEEYEILIDITWKTYFLLLLFRLTFNVLW